MKKLIVIVANGWSSSSRKRATRTKAHVEKWLNELGVDYELLGFRSSFLPFGARKMRAFVRKHQGRGRVLVCIGKSYGAKMIVENVLNRITEKLGYDQVYLGTIDPNWPDWSNSRDLTPNLNSQVLWLRKPITKAVNVYFSTEKLRKQAGALLGAPRGTLLTNIPLRDCDHHTITVHCETRGMIQDLISEAALGYPSSSGGAKSALFSCASR